MLLAASIVALSYSEYRSSRPASTIPKVCVRRTTDPSERSPVKILLVTANFAAPGVNPWLLDDLATSLVTAGHDVDVIVNSPTAPRPTGLAGTSPERLRVFSVGTDFAPGGAIGKLRSYISTGIRLHTAGWKFAKQSEYDLCIFTSIAAFSFGFPGRVRRARIAKKLLFVMWDFFPVHQMEIGRIRPGMHKILRAIERAAISPSDILAVMSPANESFMRAYHPGLYGSYVVIPPWASSPESTGTVKNQRFTVLFGGQLAKGRGVDTLLHAADVLQRNETDIDIVIAGTGPDEQALKTLAARLGLNNVNFAGQLDRGAYREILRRAHVGVAVTVPGVSVPSFPSKIVEYCANGVPVIVSVESTSDAGAFIESRGAGLVTTAGDDQQLAAAIAQLAAEHASGTLEARAHAARRVFDSELSVSVAAQRMVDATEASS